MDSLLQDLRYALRTLARSPGFSLAAVLTLALGIGANTTLFSVINAVLLRPPAQVAEPGRLVALFTSDYSGPAFGASSYPDYLDFRSETRVFSGVMAYAPRPVALGEGDDPERTGVEVVTENFFSVLGVRPAQGRFFTAEEGKLGGPAVAVISHDLWRRRYAGDGGAVGRTVVLNGRPFTIVGVAPEGFHGAMRGPAFDAWVPLTASGGVGLGTEDLSGRGSRGFFLMARLRPGITPEEAGVAMGVAARRLHAAYPQEWTDLQGEGRRITVLRESAARVPPQARGAALGFTALLAATVGVVLLVCCANVAGLMLARATARAREVGIRLSLGATRGRLVRQMLTESLLLSLLGAAAGTLAAVWATSLLSAVQPPLPLRLALDLRPDGRVLAFTAAVSLLAAVLFGLAPALRASRGELVRSLHGDPAVQAGRRRFALRDLLVAGQMAMSLLLLSGALLCLRALQGAASADPGFRAGGVLLAEAEPRPGPEPSDAERIRVAGELRDRVAALPGVTGATWAATPPVSFGVSRRGVRVQGYESARGEDMEFAFNVVGPRYFETLEIPVVRGRGIEAADRAGAPGVVVVNQSFARRFWPGQDPLGKRISISGPEGPWLSVVGVARDAQYVAASGEPWPYFYLSGLQESWGTTLHVRTAGDPEAVLPAVRRALAETAPGWTLRDGRTLEAHLAGTLLPQRMAGGAMGLFGGLAMMLAAVGLYGVVAFTVARRTREIGVRLALGATHVTVTRMVLRRGMGLALAGIAAGLPLAWGFSRLAGSVLGTGAGDPVAFAAAPLLLAGVALLASWLPARRAARVDPVAALRAE